eukprot:CAMPEP_0117667278 /NCGR_PEP_ID=MMETSP0804-20121206/10866_1 /TAXON_ID=1074897 /ORGANISM="Tetraselmis astigmatica, Strain CCMP880" /LENGTH=342 /DNA_ID=CAMNT_0005474963 /DNA_START=248 /DNA_END=1279 /DNA_ORIENTATION=+
MAIQNVKRGFQRGGLKNDTSLRRYELWLLTWGRKVSIASAPARCVIEWWPSSQLEYVPIKGPSHLLPVIAGSLNRAPACFTTSTGRSLRYTCWAVGPAACDPSPSMPSDTRRCAASTDASMASKNHSISSVLCHPASSLLPSLAVLQLSSRLPTLSSWGSRIALAAAPACSSDSSPPMQHRAAATTSGSVGLWPPMQAERGTAAAEPEALRLMRKVQQAAEDTPKAKVSLGFHKVEKDRGCCRAAALKELLCEGLTSLQLQPRQPLHGGHDQSDNSPSPLLRPQDSQRLPEVDSVCCRGQERQYLLAPLPLHSPGGCHDVVTPLEEALSAPDCPSSSTSTKQ